MQAGDRATSARTPPRPARFARREGEADGRSRRHQRIWPDRPQHPPRHRRIRPHRHRGGRGQRSRAGRDQRASAPLRFRARPLPARGEGERRHDRCRPRSDQGDGRARPLEASAQGARSVDIALECTGIFTVEGEGFGASHRRRQARARLRARRGRRPDRRLRREPRQARPRARRRLERLVHDQLPRAGRRRCCTTRSASTRAS